MDLNMPEDDLHVCREQWQRLLSYAVKIIKKISYIMIVIIIIKINQWVSQWCHIHLSVGNEWCRRKSVSTSLCLRWLIMIGWWSLNLLCLYQPYWVVYKHYSIVYNSIIIFHQFICIFTIYSMYYLLLIWIEHQTRTTNWAEQRGHIDDVYRFELGDSCLPTPEGL